MLRGREPGSGGGANGDPVRRAAPVDQNVALIVIGSSTVPLP